jgi:hypothetical protein
MMPKTYSFDPFNDFAALASLLIKFGGQLPEVGKEAPVWFLASVGDSLVPVSETAALASTITECSGSAWGVSS